MFVSVCSPHEIDIPADMSIIIHCYLSLSNIIYLYTCQSIYILIYLSVSASVSVSLSISIYVSIGPSVRLSVHPSNLYPIYIYIKTGGNNGINFNLKSNLHIPIYPL